MDKTKSEEKKVISLKKKIIKIRNSSKKKYIEIPEEFKELSHGDITDTIFRDEDDDTLSVIFVFNKKELKKRGK